MVDYALEGPRWASSTITWSLATSNLPGQSAYAAISGYFSSWNVIFSQDIAWAFDQWRQVANLQFVQVTDSASSNIRFGWASIDGPYNTLAIASYSYQISGGIQTFRSNNVIEFDSGETWVLGSDGDYHVGSSSGPTFRAVALHEIGHELGLDHYTGSLAIMNPTANSNSTLTTSDFHGIQALYGPAVNHTFIGTTGYDFLIGTSGIDQFSAGAGADLLYSGGGNDIMTGGADADAFYMAAPSAGVSTIMDFEHGVDKLTIDLQAFFGNGSSSFAFVSGTGAHATSAAPTFYFDTSLSYFWFDADGTGAAAATHVAYLPGVTDLQVFDILKGEIATAPNSSLIESTPNTTVYGVGANSTIWGNAEGDVLIGGSSGNTLIAQAHSVSLMAGGGGSLMAANGGLDTMFGGAGGDYFYFAKPDSGASLIYNFTPSQGDKIAIQGSTFGPAKNFAFTDNVGLISGPGAHPAYATATFSYDTNTGYLWYDIDGIGASHETLVAFLPQLPTLHAADFIIA
jgi:Ca2+-binding RTX toxin-like protein